MATMAFTMYPVSDMARALAFYRDALGLTPTEVQTPAWVEFDLGGSTFGIGNFPQVGTPGTAQSLALEIETLDQFRADLAALGFATDEPHQLANCRISLVHDPDGNSIYLHEAQAIASH